MRIWSLLFFVLCFYYPLSAQVYIHDPFTKLKNNTSFAKYPFAGGLNNPQFYAIDFNFDGIKDLFVFDRTGGKNLTFINNGTPGQVDYTYAPLYESILPKMENFVVMTDVNCDGVEDIFTSYDNGIKVFYSQVSGTSFSYIEVSEKLEYTSAGFTFELYVGVIDIPAIVDVNFDGDPDILNFRPAGGYVDYFENRQVENGDPCGTLSMELVTSCWGDFYESGISKSVDLDIVCKGVSAGRSGMHAGSTFLAFDYDVDADMDILLGDLSFNNLNLLTNGGDATLAHIVSQDTVFPSYDVEANIATFPAPFLIDVNYDGKKDLLVAPNKKGFSENFRNVWYYKNNSTDDTYLFTYQTDSFLVSDMVDVGEGAHPVFFDYNNDGLLDIVIGNYGYFESGDFYSSLALYKNTGTVNEPEFTLITRDYGGLLIYNFIHIKPAFYDMDNDGDTDLIIGDVNGNLHYFRNNAPAGSEPVFNLQEAFYKGIDVGISAAPFIDDLNNDGLPDLVIGEQNGNLNYYENTGEPGLPAFTLISEFWGEVDVRIAMSLTGRSAPFLFQDADDNWQLMVGSESGTIFHYKPTSDWTGAFELMTSSFSGIDEGDNSTAVFADITNDDIPELLTGNYRGGISLYKDQSTVDELSENLSVKLIVFPNPVENLLNIITEKADLWEYQIFDITGQLAEGGKFTGSHIQLNTEAWSGGVYILTIRNENGIVALYKVLKL